MTTITPTQPASELTPAERERIRIRWGEANAWVTRQLDALRWIESHTAPMWRPTEVRRKLDRDEDGQLDPGCSAPRKVKW